MKAKTRAAGPTVQGSPQTRDQLIEAAAQLVREEGCAAVTAGRLAEKVGLKRQIVHYYFGTIEDLLIAVMRREGDMVRSHLSKALESEEPLRAIWKQARGASALSLEFIALATHRKAVRIEVKRYMEEFRGIVTRALTRHMQLRGIEPKISPVAAIILVLSVTQALAVEEALDVSNGHSETKAVVEQWLTAFEKRGELVASSRKPVRARRRSS